MGTRTWRPSRRTWTGSDPSTWQAQTPYQKMRNIDPTPARLPIVDLGTGQAIIREF